MGSGRVPPPCWYNLHTLWKILARISWSALASPGGSRAFHFHWAHRAELVKEPSFSAKLAAGRRKTSVLTVEGSIPGAFQNWAVSVSKHSATTSHLSLERAAIILLEWGPLATGFMPKHSMPSSLP